MTKVVCPLPLKYPVRQYAIDRTKHSIDVARKNSAESAITADASAAAESFIKIMDSMSP